MGGEGRVPSVQIKYTVGICTLLPRKKTLETALEINVWPIFHWFYFHFHPKSRHWNLNYMPKHQILYTNSNMDNAPRTIIISLNYNLMATLIYSCLITRLLDKRPSVKTTKNHIILHNFINKGLLRG